MPTYLPGNWASMAVATSLASTTPRPLMLPRPFDFGHSHQPPPSLGSSDIDGREGSLANWERASATTNFRSPGFGMQNLEDLRWPPTRPRYSGCWLNSALLRWRILS